MIENSGHLRTRGIPTVLLAAALLAFLLPFATVSCGTPVTFTGVELATGQVHGDDPEFVAEIEDYGPIAGFAALAIMLGLGLAVAGRGGVVGSALTALLALLYLPWEAAMELADVSLHEGYVLATGSLAAVVLVEARRAWRSRKDEGRRAWPLIVGAMLLVLACLFTFSVTVGSSDV